MFVCRDVRAAYFVTLNNRVMSGIEGLSDCVETEVALWQWPLEGPHTVFIIITRLQLTPPLL